MTTQVLFTICLFSIFQVGKTEKGIEKKGFIQITHHFKISYLGIIITGSGGHVGDRSKSVEVLSADGTPLCSLPDLPHLTRGHTQHGLTTCGGTGGHIRRRCYTFDTNSGTWNVSYNLSEDRAYHTQWWDSGTQSLWLLGGSVKNIGVKSSELLQGQADNSDIIPSEFELKYTSRCGKD